MRSKWKGPFIDQNFLKQSHKILNKKRFLGWDFKVKNSRLSIQSRRSTILPFFNKNKLKIYSGNRFVLMKIEDHHIGNKFGDFILTKAKCKYSKKKKGKK